MSDHHDPRQVERFVRQFAGKALRRAHALGARSESLEDIEQELWCAWCRARDKFDPDRGVSFTTYLHRAMQMHVNRYIFVQYERLHGQTNALSLNAPADEEDDGPLSEVIADENAADPAEQALRGRMAEHIKARMTPRTRTFIEILADPPDELVSQLSDLEKKREHAKSMNLPYAPQRGVSQSLVFDLMGLGRTARAAVLREIKEVLSLEAEDA